VDSRNTVLGVVCAEGDLALVRVEENRPNLLACITLSRDIGGFCPKLALDEMTTWVQVQRVQPVCRLGGRWPFAGELSGVASSERVHAGGVDRERIFLPIGDNFV
jgi:hypothetical protein